MLKGNLWNVLQVEIPRIINLLFLVIFFVQVNIVLKDCIQFFKSLKNVFLSSLTELPTGPGDL
jgi:hypothetical protein